MLEPGVSLELGAEVRASLGPGFAFVPGAAAIAAAACVSQRLSGRALFELVTQVSRQLDVDPELAVVLTTASIGCDELFYVPVENDVRGIGYARSDPRELFDDSPGTRLEGIAFLNDYPYWRRHPDEFRRAFLHELGHRWGARVRAGSGDEAERLLGRDGEHWSYFLDTGGSPLEGNAWSPLVDGVAAADTPLVPAGFSDFDLYLMGALPAERVEPARLLDPSALQHARDCLGHPLTEASPPQSCGRLELDGSAELVSIDSVIASEGPREPAPDPSPRSLEVIVLVLSDSSDFEPRACAELGRSIAVSLADFADATRGRIGLASAVDLGASCEGFAEPAHRARVSGGCAHAPGERGSFVLSALALLVAAAARSRRFTVAPRSRRSARRGRRGRGG